MQLILPSIAFQESYLAALQEFHHEGRNLEWSLTSLRQDFTPILTFLDRMSRGIGLPDGHVAWTQYWLVDGSTYIGRANIRHELSPDLLRVGGHIGYEIRPSQRRKGYGTALLRLALDTAREKHQIARALVTCDNFNTASRRMIEAAGGVLASDLGASAEDEELRYWIDTTI